jgi:hypothetical protein
MDRCYEAKPGEQGKRGDHTKSEETARNHGTTAQPGDKALAPISNRQSIETSAALKDQRDAGWKHCDTADWKSALQE